MAYSKNQLGYDEMPLAEGGRLTIKDDLYGLRRVNFLKTEDDMAVFDDDVVYGTVNELRSREYNASQSSAFDNLAFSMRNVA